MQGFPLDSCNYSLYDNDTTDFSVSIMDSLNNDMETVSWLPLITMKEELITHMKESVVIDEPVNESINNLSKDLIKFMKGFTVQKKRMDEAEIKMKKVIEDTQRDIDVITTFIEFLSKISKQTDKDMDPIQSQIKTMCDDIETNSKMKEVKQVYLVEKHKFHQHLNVIRLLNQMNVGSTCSICLQDNVNSYFDPCGHTACLTCCDKNTEYSNDNCPLCRKHINSVRKLYFS